MKEKRQFITKITVAHVVTYFVCGLIFSNLFNYNELFHLGIMDGFMKDAYGVTSMIGPLVQVFRGILFGFLFLLFKESIWGKPHAWLRLWAVVAGIGIICTPGPCPFSIEGFVYTNIPLEFHLKGAPEILVQTLLFSVWVTNEKKLTISENLKVPFIVTAISGVGFSLSGIILALVLKADVMKSASDPFAFMVMAVALVIVFFLTKWYIKRKPGITSVVYYIVSYLALAGLPTAYNYLTDSMLKSPWSLLFSGLPVIVIAIYLTIFHKNNVEENE